MRRDIYNCDTILCNNEVKQGIEFPKFVFSTKTSKGSCSLALVFDNNGEIGEVCSIGCLINYIKTEFDRAVDKKKAEENISVIKKKN